MEIVCKEDFNQIMNKMYEGGTDKPQKNLKESKRLSKYGRVQICARKA